MVVCCLLDAIRLFCCVSRFGLWVFVSVLFVCLCLIVSLCFIVCVLLLLVLGLACVVCLFVGIWFSFCDFSCLFCVILIAAVFVVILLLLLFDVFYGLF